MDLRNIHKIKLAKLKDTDDLRKRLPLRNVFLTEKKNGTRNTLQLGSSTYLVSRSKHNKTKGVDASKDSSYIVQDLEPWMLSLGYGVDVILEGELSIFGGESTSSEVLRLDTEKQFEPFDIIWYGGDIRDKPHKVRMELLQRVCEEINHPRLSMVPYQVFEEFTEQDLECCFEIIKQEKIEGFVLKEADREYDLNWWGWKIKCTDTADGFIVAVSEGKNHHLGEVVKTGLTGAYGIAQYADGKSKLIAWVPVPKDQKIPLDRKDEVLGRIVEFSHKGWDTKAERFSFPQFVCFRADKPKEDCIFKG